jgi:ribonuclease BN (tRNA processing enzyme)
MARRLLPLPAAVLVLSVGHGMPSPPDALVRAGAPGSPCALLSGTATRGGGPKQGEPSGTPGQCADAAARTAEGRSGTWRPEARGFSWKARRAPAAPRGGRSALDAAPAAAPATSSDRGRPIRPLSAGGTAAAAQGAAAAALPPAPRTRLVLLGTGTPNAEPDRSGPALAVIVDDTAYVVDVGPGVVRRAAAAAARGLEALSPGRLRIGFVTHLHSDHTAGYADFILTPAVLERDAPLLMMGPPGLRAMTDRLLAAYAEDIDIRLHGLEPAKPAGYDVRVRELQPGGTYEDARVTVTAVPVRHGNWRHAYGYRFRTPDRTIVISGDCAPTEALAAACAGCDILVHEVYSDAGFRTRPPEWQKYHAAFHTSARELGELARRARPRLLVLYHQLYWGTPDEALVAEVRAVYDGPVVSGRDLDVF